MCSTRKKELFGENYFDSGKRISGAYEYYTFQDAYLTFKNLCDLIKKHFDPRRVLDLGCAKGFLVYALRKMGIDAFGVDISKYAISCAQLDVQPYLYEVNLDRDSLPFGEDYFDFITFLGTIEYLHNHRHVINEIERVLVRGGSLLLTYRTSYRRVRNNTFRINTHSKAYWINVFGSSWRTSEVYYNFLSDYFQKLFVSRAPIYQRTIGKALYKILNREDFILLWDLSTTLGILKLGILLFTLVDR